MAIYDLYGIRAECLEDAKVIVERMLGCTFVERDGLYHGIHYICGAAPGENFELNENRDPFEGVPNEEGFPTSKWLLYVNDTARSKELQAVLTRDSDSVVLLRHEDLE